MQYSLTCKACNGNVEDVRTLQGNGVTATTTLDRRVHKLGFCSFILLACSKGLIGNRATCADVKASLTILLQQIIWMQEIKSTTGRICSPASPPFLPTRPVDADGESASIL